MRKMSSEVGVSLPKASEAVQQPWQYSTTDLPGSKYPMVKQTRGYEKCERVLCRVHRESLLVSHCKTLASASVLALFKTETSFKV